MTKKNNMGCCPICGKSLQPEEKFCSDCCRDVSFDRWFERSYSFGEHLDEEDERYKEQEYGGYIPYSEEPREED